MAAPFGGALRALSSDLRPRVVTEGVPLGTTQSQVQVATSAAPGGGSATATPSCRFVSSLRMVTALFVLFLMGGYWILFLWDMLQSKSNSNRGLLGIPAVMQVQQHLKLRRCLSLADMKLSGMKTLYAFQLVNNP